MKIIIENENGSRKEFGSTLEAFAYEQAEFMISENKVEVDDEEKFQEILATELNNYLTFNEKAFNYDELSNIYNEVYEEYKKSAQEEDVYLLKISYSWGDEEGDLKYPTMEEAWGEAKEYAFKEAESYSFEHNCEVGIRFFNETNRIMLHYCDNDEYCFYDVVKF